MTSLWRKNFPHSNHHRTTTLLLFPLPPPPPLSHPHSPPPPPSPLPPFATCPLLPTSPPPPPIRCHPGLDLGLNPPLSILSLAAATEEVKQVLETLKQASHNLQSNKSTELSNSINVLLELETESESILPKDPYLPFLSRVD